MIDLKVDLKGFQSDIDKTLSKHEKALSDALNWTAFDIRESLVDEMKSVFDMPTPWAKGSVYVDKANPDRQAAKVDMAKGRGKINASWQYEDGLFAPHVHGGERRYKRFEVLLNQRGLLPDGMNIVPGSGARLNQFGNMSPGSIIKVLSDVRAHDERGFMMNNRHHLSGFKRLRVTDEQGRYMKLKKSERSKNRATHFVKRDGSGKPVGVWKRVGGMSSRKVIPVWHFVKRAKYKSRFDFFGVAQRVRDKKFKDAYQRALRRELAK